MENSTRQVDVIDVTPRSIFVSLGSESYLVFPRNTIIPCQKRIQFQQVNASTAIVRFYTQDKSSSPEQLLDVALAVPSKGKFALILDMAIDGNGMLSFINSFQKIYRSAYEQYLDSLAWQTKRQEALSRAGNRCQLCGTASRLDVHHNTYERFGNELPSDLIVLCRSCHELADKRRKAERDNEIYDRRLTGWAKKVYGEYWEESPGYEVASERFDNWLESRNDG